MAEKDKQVATNSSIKPEVVSPWTDDSGPNIIEIIHNPANRNLLTPANLGHLLSVSFLYFSCCELFSSVFCKWLMQVMKSNLSNLVEILIANIHLFCCEHITFFNS